MALPTYTVVSTALKNLAAVALEDKTAVGARELFDAINDVAALAQKVSKTTYYRLQLPRELFVGLDGVNQLKQVSMTDTLYADVAALVAAQSLTVGDSFVIVLATNDVTDNALATAKSGAVAAGDVYMLITSTTVLYLGTVAALVN